MSDFKAKMHQIRFRLGLRPRPRCGELPALNQTPWLDLRGLHLREGMREEGREEKEGEGAKRGGKGRGGEGGEGRERRPFW